MKISKQLWATLLALFLIAAITALPAFAAGTKVNFPLMSADGKDLVADQNTKYVVYLDQDAATKLITATLRIENGAASGKPIVFGGVGLEITFNDKVAPYYYDPQNNTFNPSRLYVNAGPTESAAEFDKYCYRPIPTFSTVGSSTVQNNASGRFIGAKISTVTEEGSITLAPGAAITIAQVYFMPVNGTDALNIDMFSFKWQVNADRLIRLSTWMANGSRFVVSNEDFPTSVATYVLSPATFKMHVQLPIPNVSPNNSARTITGYDSSTMAWADSANGAYSRTAPTIGSAARTIYVKAIGTNNYTGNDAEYGSYKMSLDSPAVEVRFNAVGSNDYTVTFNANGGSFSSGESTQIRYVAPNGTVGSDNMPANPTISSGESFSGWNTAYDGSGSSFTSSTAVNGNITVYAQYSGGGGGTINPPVTSEYTITFDKNYQPSPTVITTVSGIKSGESVGSRMPDNPTRVGFNFTGWNLSPTGTGTVFTSTTAVTGNWRVYAQWTAVNASVVDPNIGTTVTINPEQPPLAGFLADHIPYINGYPDNTVKPNNAITRAEVAAIFFRLLSSPEKNNPRTSVFRDAVEGSWYTQSVSYLASIEILTGYPDGTFKPNQSITRAEFAAVASRFDQLAVTTTNAFPDIENHWAKDYINSAYTKGWVSGYPDGTFKPQQDITRAEVVKVVNTMLNRKIRPEDIPPGIMRFTDYENHWAYADIVEASNDHNYTRKADGFEVWTLK